MKNLVVALCAWAALSVSARAGLQAGVLAEALGGPGVSFAGQGSIGLLNGEAKEHVFDNEVSPGSRYQVSRLDWDLKDVAMGGGNVSIRPFKGAPSLGALTLNAGGWMALTEGGGEMDDYDWLMPDTPQWTHYSLSEVDVTEGYVVDANAAWDFWRRPGAAVRGMVGYKQDGWSWEDRIVYLQYVDEGYMRNYDYEGENGINYEQEFRMPYVGAGADFASGAFTLSARLVYSWLVSATDWDEHVMTETSYKETFEDGEMLGLGVEVRYDFTRGGLRGAFVSAGLDWQRIDLIVGDMEYVDEATGEIGGGADVAGIENEYLALSLGAGMRF